MGHAIRLLPILVVSVAARMTGQDTCFMVSAENLARGAGNFFLYATISERAYTFQKGDKLEYDIMLSPSNPLAKGGLDIEVGDDSPARDRKIADQNGLLLHGDAILKPAVGKWYHRVFDLAPLAGLTSSQWNVAFEGDEIGRYIQFLDNIRVTRDGQTVCTLYDDGLAPPIAEARREGYGTNVLAISLPRQDVLDNQTVKDAFAKTERSNKLQRESAGFHIGLDIARALAEKSGRTAIVDEAAALEDRAAFEAGDQAAYHGSLVKAGVKLQSLAHEIRPLSLYLVGNAHVDFEWLWTWDETVNHVLPDTFGQALKFMEEYPEFHITQSSPGLYLPLEQRYPELFRGIKKYVKEGRWEIVGGRWTEADTNIISPESHARQFLYGQRYFLAKFGHIATVGWEPDTFGHMWQMPQLLRESGIDAYYFCRSGKGQPIFWWQGLDGSKVLAYDNESAGGGYNQGIADKEAKELLAINAKTGSKTDMVVYGIGNHGGGPTREHLEFALEMKHRDVWPAVKFTTARDYFDSILNQSLDLPTVNEELNSIFEGCYTTHGETKRMNRDSETLLETGEVFSALNSLHGSAYPRAAYRDLWRIVLWSQHHDTIGGSYEHLPSVETKPVYRSVIERGTDILQRAEREIASRIRSAGAGTRAVVFNPLAWERTGIVDTELTLPAKVKSLALADAAGPVPTQILSRRVDGDVAVFRVCFVARGVPGCGYKTFRVQPGSGSKGPASGLLGPYDPDDGIAADTLKADDPLLRAGSRPVARLQVLHEKPTIMSAWVVGEIDSTTVLEKPHSIKLIEDGPVRRRIRTTYTYNHSTIIEDAVTYPGQDRTDFDLNVEWLEVGTEKDGGPFLKAAVNTTAKAETATYDIPFGAIERKAEGRECAALKWCDVSDENGGVTFLNDCRNAYAVKDGVMQLGLLRATYDPDPTPDVGRHRMRYAAVHHTGKLDKAAAARLGWEFNKPMQTVIVDGIGKGTEPASWSGCAASPANIIVTAVKCAEDGDGFIIRAYECAGKATAAKVVLGFEAKRVRQTNLLELDMPTQERMSLSGKTMTAEFRPYEIRTFRVNK